MIRSITVTEQANKQKDRFVGNDLIFRVNPVELKERNEQLPAMRVEKAKGDLIERSPQLT